MWQKDQYHAVSICTKWHKWTLNEKFNSKNLPRKNVKKRRDCLRKREQEFSGEAVNRHGIIEQDGSII